MTNKLLPDDKQTHKWDGDGERCSVCGDKDWFAEPYCRGAAPALLPEKVKTRDLEEAKQYAQHLISRSDNDKCDQHTITLYRALCGNIEG